MANILILEDQIEIRDFVVINVKRAGHKVLKLKQVKSTGNFEEMILMWLFLTSCCLASQVMKCVNA